jgi:hypothetical protein
MPGRVVLGREPRRCPWLGLSALASGCPHFLQNLWWGGLLDPQCACSFYLTVRTGHWASRNTCSATLPSSMR